MGIEKILEIHADLFGATPIVEHSSIGFTNDIYIVNNKYVVKICTDKKNELNFKKDINYYLNNDYSFLPKLYAYDTSKKNYPYIYEILEKVNGVSLYCVWDDLDDSKRESIICTLCIYLKILHKDRFKGYDWAKYIKSEFSRYYKPRLFSVGESYLVEYAISKYYKYLGDNDFRIVHNDLHFDNIIYDDGDIKIIDFERSMVAPIDYELDILFRMVNNPWKFASEELESSINSSNYTNIKAYIERFYPDLVEHKFIKERLALYNMLYYMRQIAKFGYEESAKEEILKSASVVVYNDELTFDNLSSEYDIMNYLDINVEYGWINKNGDKVLNSLNKFREQYHTLSIEDSLKYGVGTCIEQAYMTYVALKNIGYNPKLYCFRYYEDKDNDDDIKMHLFVLYEKDGGWYHIEHANPLNKGIHRYDTITSAINDLIKEHIDRRLTLINDVPSGLTYKEFNLYVNSFDKQKRS